MERNQSGSVQLQTQEELLKPRKGKDDKGQMSRQEGYSTLSSEPESGVDDYSSVNSTAGEQRAFPNSSSHTAKPGDSGARWNLALQARSPGFDPQHVRMRGG